jgi:EAL domain-containing protein (putative c-di-GMP-specific phosphodiesterase class I)
VFIPLAEEIGLINEIGEWVLRTACSEAANWPQHITVAVNLSPVQFKSHALPARVRAVLAETGLAANRLELEITEGVFLSNDEHVHDMIRSLKDIGLKLALDDFGTGYSSLSYLHRFSFDRIKIDHSFIRDILRNEGSLMIVRAIVMLAHSLGLVVTAEGVETDDQLAAVRGEGCDSVQGYYIGRPMPLADFQEFVGNSRGASVTAA